MSAVYAYSRVSASDPEAGPGTQAQKAAKAEKYYRDNLQSLGLVWGGAFTDTAASGGVSFREREAGSILFGRLKRGDHVIFDSAVTSFRSSVDQSDVLLTLLARGVTPHFTEEGIDGSSPAGKLIVKVMADADKAERARKSERGKAYAAEQKKQGLAHTRGRPPWGWKVSRRKGDRKRVLVLDDHEIKVARRAYELHCDGTPYELIAQAMRLHGIRSRTGGELGAMSFWNIIKSYEKLLADGKLPECWLPRAPAATQPCDNPGVQNLNTAKP